MNIIFRWLLWAVSAVVLAVNLLLPANRAHAQSPNFVSTICADSNNTSIDVIAPTLSAFTLPATGTGPTIPVLNFTASDNVGVTGYLVTSSATVPAASDSGWNDTTPARITASSAGVLTFYAWAKDAEGNVSAPRSATVTITLEADGDVTKPALTVSTLDDDAITNSRALKVRGNAADDGTLQSVTVNGNNAPLDANGHFVTTVILVEGENVITVVATDAAGNRTTNARAITYIVNAPELAGISPAVHPVSVQEIRRGIRGRLV